MSRTSYAVLGVVLLVFVAGCPAERAEHEKLRAELAEARAELKALRDQPPPALPGKDSYLDQLERLEALKSKGALTEEEFLAKKRTILATPAPSPTTPLPQVKVTRTFQELDRQLREVQGLWNKNVLNASEYNDAKKKILSLPFRVEALAADLDKVQNLWNQSILTAPEYTGLKRSVLQQLRTDVPRTMADLDGQLREVQGLWNRSVLNASEYNEAKAKLLQQPLRGANLAADLDRVSALWNQNILNASEYNNLKKKVLQIDSGK